MTHLQYLIRRIQPKKAEPTALLPYPGNLKTLLPNPFPKKVNLPVSPVSFPSSRPPNQQGWYRRLFWDPHGEPGSTLQPSPIPLVHIKKNPNCPSPPQVRDEAKNNASSMNTSNLRKDFLSFKSKVEISYSTIKSTCLMLLKTAEGRGWITPRKWTKRLIQSALFNHHF